MPHDDAESDTEEAESEHEYAEFASIDDLTVSEDVYQASILRVSFDWCATVREVGQRYRKNESIATIAADLELPFSKTERALSIYYLLFSEPPIDGVRSMAFTNGKRYFRDGQSIEELDAETRDGAEKHVREFVGRTLIDSDLDKVDIDEPVPEMEVPSLNVLSELAIEGPLLTEPQSMMAGVMPDIELMFEQVMSGMVDQIHQDMQTMFNQRLRGIQQAVQVSGIGRNAVAPALASSALASTISASAVSAIEPSVFQVMNQPALHGLGMITETYTLQIEQLAQILTQSVTLDVALAFQSFPSTVELVNQSATVWFAESLQSLNEELAGITVAGAVAAKPYNLEQVSEHQDFPAEFTETGNAFVSQLYPVISDIAIWEIAVHFVAMILLFLYPENRMFVFVHPTLRIILLVYRRW